MHCKLSVVAFRECDLWVAQSLEQDFANQNQTFDGAIYGLASMVAAGFMFRLKNPGLEVPSPAPSHCWDRFHAVKEEISKTMSFEISADESEIYLDLEFVVRKEAV